MNKIQKTTLLATVFTTAAFLTSCGNHDFLGDLSEIFGFSSSSYERLSSSSEGLSNSSVRLSSASSATEEGGYGLTLTAFTASKTSVSQNETFTVSSGFGNDYVTAIAFPGGLVGTALVDNNGNMKAVTGIRTLGALEPRTPSRISAYGAKEATCIVPNIVASGKYQLRMVALIEGDEEWQIVVHSRTGIPASIDFENKTSAENSKRKSP